MKKNIRNIFVVLTLMAFLLPSVIKLDHHHENHTCQAKSEKHLHQGHENCAVCDFEFSIFTHDINYPDLRNVFHSSAWCNLYISETAFSHTGYSFLLRGPPCKQI